MTYEPRGKVALLLGAMRGAAQPIWSSTDVAQRMEVPQGNLSAYLHAVIGRGLLHRKIEGGKAFYSLRPFADDEPLPAEPPKERGYQVPKFNGFVPPSMTPPRGGQALPPAGPRPEPIAMRTQRFPAPAATPPAPSPAPEPEVYAEVEVDAEVNEEVAVDTPTEFNAILHLDGDLDLWGLIELENDGLRIEAANVARLRRMLEGKGC